MTISWCPQCGEHHAPLNPTRSPIDDPWRQRLIAIEAELAALRASLAQLEQEIRTCAAKEGVAHHRQSWGRGLELAEIADKIASLIAVRVDQREVDPRD